MIPKKANSPTPATTGRGTASIFAGSPWTNAPAAQHMALLDNKTALITGGSRGIGRGIVERFLEEGADVAFTYVSSPDRANAAAAELAAKYGRKVLAIQSDAGDFEQAQKTVDEVVAAWGRLDVLVNNAGITKDQLLMRMSEADFDAVIQTNLKSVFNMTKAVMRTMLKQRSGSIINMSSVVGVKGNAGQANYAASKAGIIGFTKSVALELGSRNIRSNAIAPGFIETEMTGALDQKVVEQWREGIPLKRGGTPTDVANACVFLGSDLSSYITGQTLHVCGGMLT
jgi:3-oxoacyl-[acyl-carrier protein] reductase